MKIKLLSIEIYLSQNQNFCDWQFFCFTKGSPFGYLTSSGGYWKKQIVKTGCFALRKSREAKQWIAAKLCVMKQQGNKKGDKKEKA